jgi:hypothetical protein
MTGNDDRRPADCNETLRQSRFGFLRLDSVGATEKATEDILGIKVAGRIQDATGLLKTINGWWRETESLADPSVGSGRPWPTLGQANRRHADFQQDSAENPHSPKKPANRGFPLVLLGNPQIQYGNIGQLPATSVNLGATEKPRNGLRRRRKCFCRHGHPRPSLRSDARLSVCFAC